MEGGCLRAQPPESPNPFCSLLLRNMALPACPSRNLWSAQSAGFLSGESSARCIPLSPLPIYSGSGCVKPCCLPTHRHFSNDSGCFSAALPVPRHAPLSAALCPARSGQVAFTPPAHHAIVTGHSVTPFVCALRPAPPVARTRRFNCLAEATPSLRFSGQRRLGPGSAWSYLEHSHQSAAFEAPANNAGTGYHSGSHTPCAVIPVLHYSSHVGWTSMRPDLPGMSEAPASA